MEHASVHVLWCVWGQDVVLSEGKDKFCNLALGRLQQVGYCQSKVHLGCRERSCFKKTKKGRE